MRCQIIKKKLSAYMDEALQLMQKGQFADRALGAELSKIYKHLKRAEILAFWAEITPLEQSTYL